MLGGACDSASGCPRAGGLALVFAAALELSHGLAVRSALQEDMWPTLEGVAGRKLAPARRRVHEHEPRAQGPAT
jgi:hypothetical protein